MLLLFFLINVVAVQSTTNQTEYEDEYEKEEALISAADVDLIVEAFVLVMIIIGGVIAFLCLCGGITCIYNCFDRCRRRNKQLSDCSPETVALKFSTLDNQII